MKQQPIRIHQKFYDDKGEEIIRHERRHGCYLVLKRQENVTDRHFLKIFTCLKHDVEVCGASGGVCGIPFGRHDEYCQIKRHESRNKV